MALPHPCPADTGSLLASHLPSPLRPALPLAGCGNKMPFVCAGRGGGSLQLLAAESQLPAGLWGQRVTGDWPGGREPKTLEVTSGNLTLH